MNTEYYLAQICRNGHALETALEEQHLSARHQKHPFCSQCGADTLVECEKCETPIHGQKALVVKRGSSWIGEETEERYPEGEAAFTRPAYCHRCGSLYPWTEAALEAARQLIEETDDIDDDEKTKISDSLPDLLADTPKTQVAIARMQKWLSKVTVFTGNALKEIIVSVATEAVKKQLGI